MDSKQLLEYRLETLMQDRKVLLERNAELAAMVARVQAATSQPSRTMHGIDIIG